MMDEYEMEVRLRLREVEDNLGMLMVQRSMYQEKLSMAEWANVDDMYEKKRYQARIDNKSYDLMHGGKGAPREAHRGRIPNLDYMPPFFIDRNGECPVLPDVTCNQNIVTGNRKRWVASEKRTLHKAVVADLMNGMRNALDARIEACEKRIKNPQSVVQFKSVEILKTEEALRECIARDSAATGKQIRNAVEKMISKAPRENLVDWQAISKEMNGKRTADECRAYWCSVLAPCWSKTRVNSKKDYRQLDEVIEKWYEENPGKENIDWVAISARVQEPRRSPWQWLCAYRKREVRQRAPTRWDRRERMRLLQLVIEHTVPAPPGVFDVMWHAVADRLSNEFNHNRTRASCIKAYEKYFGASARDRDHSTVSEPSMPGRRGRAIRRRSVARSLCNEKPNVNDSVFLGSTVNLDITPLNASNMGDEMNDGRVIDVLH